MGLTPGGRAEGGGRRADTGRTMKGYGGRRTADEEKFLLCFSTAKKISGRGG